MTKNTDRTYLFIIELVILGLIGPERRSVVEVV